MKPKELGQQIGVDPKKIRQFARKRWGKQEGSWNFTPTQIEAIKEHFSQTPTATVRRENSLAAPTYSQEYWKTIEGLTAYAKKWLRETYDMELTIPIRFNPRLTRALGRFHFRTAPRRPQEIDLSTRLLEYYGEEATLDVLKHELIHYACFMQRMPFSDGDWYFENELKRLGVTRTHVYKAKGHFHHYSCSVCGKHATHRARQIRSLWKYRSRCCDGMLVYEGRKEIR